MKSGHQKIMNKINTSTEIYSKFGKYYDILYDKFIDYRDDCDFFEELFKRHYDNATNHMKLLDLGCGTGNHAIEFARRGYDVTALDFSETCITTARNKLSNEDGLKGSVDFLMEDLRFLDFKHEFDVVFAVFGVLSYIPESENIGDIFSKIHEGIKPGGLFFGEFWHKPGVPDEFEFTTHSGKPSENLELIRVASGKRLEGTKTIRVDMEFTLINVKTGEDLDNFSEIHHLRCFDLDELKALLGSADLQIVDFMDVDGKNYNFKPVKSKTFTAFFISKAA
jgi:SAM-dependent methyltransferase